MLGYVKATQAAGKNDLASSHISETLSIPEDPSRVKLL